MFPSPLAWWACAGLTRRCREALFPSLTATIPSHPQTALDGGREARLQDRSCSRAVSPRKCERRAGARSAHPPRKTTGAPAVAAVVAVTGEVWDLFLTSTILSAACERGPASGRGRVG